MRLGSEPDDGRDVLIVGDDAVAEIAATRLDGRIGFLGTDDRIVTRVADDVYDVEYVDDVRHCDLPDHLDVTVVATATDSQNLLAVQQLRLGCDVDHVIVRLNEPRNRAVFEDLGVETVCAATTVGKALQATYADTVDSTE